jgi:hypothetical protein
MRGVRAGSTVLIVLALSALWLPALAEEQAVISLGVAPMPPECAANPVGTATISWTIQHQTVPDHVLYRLYDPTHTIVYDEVFYPGDTGVTGTRDWTVPYVIPQGFHRAHVEYWSQGIGLEAWAETGFLVCASTSQICVAKFADTDCDGVLGPDDLPVSGWTVGLITPSGEQLIEQTGPDGTFCWFGLPYGPYTVFEVMQPGWIPIYPESVPVNLGGDPADVTFFNFRYEDCAGICCVDEVCYFALADECAAMGGTFHPEWDSCGPPNPCLATPSLPDTWGGVKNAYR